MHPKPGVCREETECFIVGPIVNHSVVKSFSPQKIYVTFYISTLIESFIAILFLLSDKNNIS